MIAFLLAVAVVAAGGWFVCFVVLAPTRETLPISTRQPGPNRPAAGNAGHTTPHTGATWTALDDYQLARLLHDPPT